MEEQLRKIRLEERADGNYLLFIKLTGGGDVGVFGIGEPGNKTAWELERLAARIRRGMLSREGKADD